jgi:O-succinylbenzoate synthase
MRLNQRANKMDFRFAFRRYALRFRRPVRTFDRLWEVREGLFVRLERPDGLVGYGEASPLPTPGSESVDELEAYCQSLGERFDDELLSSETHRYPTLSYALACALGAEVGPARHASLKVAALLPAGRTAPAEAATRAEAGFRAFKWKVGVGDAGDEMAILDDILAELPNGSKLRLDANGAWNLKTAERWLDHCVGRPIEFVEQPVSPESKSAEDFLRGLGEDSPVPLALDESIRGEGDVDRWLDFGWPGYYVIKPALLGRPFAVLSKLAAREARVVFSSSLETAIGAQSALRHAFAWPGPVTALGFGVWPLFERSIFDGLATAPFVRVEDVERLEPSAVWNASNLQPV